MSPALDTRFANVEREVARLRNERKAGRLNEAAYKAALQGLMIEHRGRW